MNKKMIGAVIVVGVAAVAYFAWQMSRQAPAPEVTTVAPREVPPAAKEAPAVRFPLEAPSDATAAPLPALDASDKAFGDAVAELLGVKSLPDYFYPDAMIRRFVATVDNLPRSKASARLMPVRPVDGAFEVVGMGDQWAIDPANAARYQLYVAALEGVDVPTLVDLYVRFYPLFQQAYQELGYPNGYFNDRLVEVIDDLLGAPKPQEPIRLVRPNVLYQFADPDLEARSAGQKIMIRMGRDNASRVAVVLRAIRTELVSRTTLK